MKVARAQQGILLPDYGIGLDVGGNEGTYRFVSHAHGDHVPHRDDVAVYASPATAALLRARGFGGGITELPFGEPVDLPDARVTLLPAGHILGSAMTYVETAAGALLYTGDYRTPAAPTTEGCSIPGRVDYLITEGTFALPIYRWEKHETLFERIRRIATDALDAGQTPIFLGYNLGKAQEVMHALAPLGRKVQIHGAGFKLCGVYERFGVDLGDYESYDGRTAAGKILIMPPGDYRSGMARHLRSTRVAYCSGWAALEARRTQLVVDDLVPLSDHLDFFELMDLCRRLAPRHVWITHTPEPRVLRHYLDAEDIESSFLHFEPAEAD
jgi:putative mRNA 3-end processing factor